MYIESSLIYLPHGEFSVYPLLLIKLKIMVNLVLRHVFTLQLFSVDTFKKCLNHDIQKLIYLTKGSDNKVVEIYVQKGSRGGRP